jgi:hypothetical protein
MSCDHLIGAPGRRCATLPRLLAIAAIGLGLHVAALAADAPSAKRPTPTSDSDPFPITVRVVPNIVLASRPAGAARPSATANHSVTISGSTLVAGERAVAVTVATEGGAAVGSDQSRPDAKGNYSLVAAAPAKSGVYRVDVVAPDGRGKASVTFRAVEPSDLGAQADAAVLDAVKAVDDGVNAAEAKIDAQVDSPAKDKAKQKIADAKKAVADLRSQVSKGALKGIIGAISSDAALLEAMRPKLEAVTAAVSDTTSETQRVRALTSQMSSADIGCHQLAFVTEVFKGISALLNVKKKVLDTSIGLAKDIVSDSASNKAKAFGAGPGLALATEQAVKNLPDLNSASKLAGNAYSIFADLGAFVSGTVFGMYCEQFVGPVEGIMNARFFRAPHVGDAPALWWSYNYKITGRIILYYPKSAKGSPSINLNGRIEGYAHDFETWEDALTVIFPNLMNGAIQHHFNFPPIEMGSTGSTVASQGGGATSPYVEGSAAGLLGPNSFMISVVGVLEKGSITVVLGEAKKDIDATHRVAVLILSPLTGGLGPQVTWYPLGFQKTRNFLVNAADGESLKLAVTTQGDKMIGQSTFGGQVDKVKAKAEYTLKVKACNPGC